MSLINTQVQAFQRTKLSTTASSSPCPTQSIKGKWNVFIFMPAAFTFNCPTEVEDAADNYAEFQKAGAEVYIVTTDTHFVTQGVARDFPCSGQSQVPPDRRPHTRT